MRPRTDDPTALSFRLAFKGGTAPKRCYFGDYRFSEDLDFTLVVPLGTQDIREGVGAACATTSALSAVTFSFDREDRHRHENSFTFFMAYDGVWPRQAAGNEVKIDVTLTERLVFPLERRPVLQGYPEYSDIPTDAFLTVYSIGEIAVEKVVALVDPARNEPRDLYDLEFLITGGHVDHVDVSSAVRSKLEFRRLDVGDACAALDRKERRLKALWKARLDAQLQVLPEFEGAYRTVRRWFRKVGL